MLWWPRQTPSTGILPANAPIIASDRDPKAIDAAQRNAQTAGVQHLIEFHTCDFENTPMPDGAGLVILNPEYGKRLGDERALESTYAAIGDFFKQRCAGRIGAIFTGNLELAKKVGLKPRRRIPLMSADLECRLILYEMYQGSRRVESVE